MADPPASPPAGGPPTLPKASRPVPTGIGRVQVTLDHIVTGQGPGMRPGDTIGAVITPTDEHGALMPPVFINDLKPYLPPGQITALEQFMTNFVPRASEII